MNPSLKSVRRPPLTSPETPSMRTTATWSRLSRSWPSKSRGGIKWHRKRTPRFRGFKARLASFRKSSMLRRRSIIRQLSRSKHSPSNCKVRANRSSHRSDSCKPRSIRQLRKRSSPTSSRCRRVKITRSCRQRWRRWLGQ